MRFYLENLSGSIPLFGAGTLRRLAVASEEWHADFRHVPAVAELLQGFSLVAWNGYFAYRETSVALLKQLEGAMMKVLIDVNVRMNNSRHTGPNCPINAIASPC